MGELIANLRAAYKERITVDGWMDQATKTQALAKPPRSVRKSGIR